MIWWGLAALTLVVAAPVLREAARPRIDRASGRVPGAFATLSRGRTQYRWHGPEGGPVTVCVHGLTTPSFVWEGLVPGLVAEGHAC